MAWVDYGANHREFAVVKEDTPMARTPQELTLQDVQKAHGLLGELVEIFKTDGQMTPEVIEVVVEKLDAAALLILPPEEPHQPATVTLQDGLVQLRKQLEQLSTQATAADYVLGDQVDSVVDLAKQLEVQAEQEVTTAPPVDEGSTETPAVQADSAPTEDVRIEEPQTQEPQAEAAAEPSGTEDAEPGEPAQQAEAASAEPTEPIEAAPAEAPAATEPELTEPVPPANPAAPPVEAAPEVQAAPTSPATVEGGEAAPAGTPTDANGIPAAEVGGQVATTDAPGGVTAEQVSEIVQKAVANLQDSIMANVQKSLNALPVPASQPAAVIQAPPQPEQARDPLEEMDLASSADLNKIDEYGRFKG